MKRFAVFAMIAGLFLAMTPSQPGAQVDCRKIKDNVLSLQCLAAEEQRKNPFDPDNPSDWNKDRLGRSVRFSGIHCPKIIRSKKESENAGGYVIRLTCASEDDKSKWDVRMTGFPIKEAKFEPW